MKILCLNPPFLPRFSRSQRSPAVTKSGTLYYPLWLAYLTGILEKSGHEVKLLDAPAQGLSHENVLNITREFSPALIIIDTSTPSIFNDIEVAQDLKRCLRNSFVVLVGTHVSALPEETLKIAQGIDAIVRGEYDLTICELAQQIKTNNLKIEDIKGISYQKNETIMHNPDRPINENLDSMPFVSKVYKEHLDIKKYFFAASLYPQVQILTARGCPFKCFFCLWPQSFQGRIYRKRSAQDVVNEFIYIKNELPEVKAIVIEDDTFSVDKNRVLEICDLLIKNKVNLKWNANVRTDLDIETAKRMKDAGCYLLIVGIENVAQHILDNIDKGLKANNIQKFFDNAKELGLLVHAAFMAGNPGETESTLKNNFRLAKKFLPDTIQFFPLMPYPGTKAYQWAKNNGYLRINSFRDYLTKEGLHNCIIELPGLSREKIVKWCDKSRNSFYLSPRYLFYKIKQVLLKPGDAIRTYKAFLTFRKYILRS